MFWWQSLIIAASTGTISAISTLLAIKLTNRAGDERLKNQLDAENARAIESHANERKLRADEARSKFERQLSDRVIEITAGLIAKAEMFGVQWQHIFFYQMVVVHETSRQDRNDDSKERENMYVAKIEKGLDDLTPLRIEVRTAQSELRLLSPGLVEVSARELIELIATAVPTPIVGKDEEFHDGLQAAIDKLVKATRAFIDA